MTPDKNLISFKTVLGWAGVVATEQGICRIVLPKRDRKTVERELNNANSELRSAKNPPSANCLVALERAVELLQKYFSGERVSFDLSLDVGYHTPFQKTVWRAAAEIPYGETRSYAWIAKRIRNLRAARAVGQAMGANPIPIIIP